MEKSTLDVEVASWTVIGVGLVAILSAVIFAVVCCRNKKVKTCPDHVGLTNLGNTCYMNSALQALYMCDGFRKQLLQSPTQTDHPVTMELKKLFEKMDKKPKISGAFSVRPDKFYEVGLPPWFPKYTQQDSADMMRYVLSQIHEEHTGRDYQCDSSLQFYGKQEFTYTCGSCKNVSKVVENFVDLPLSIHSTDSNKNRLNVYNLIHRYLSCQDLNGNSYYCIDCGKTGQASKESNITVCPKYLILTLMRFRQDPKTREHVKLCHNVIFPTIITVQDDHQYVLCCVIIHSGNSLTSGHYYCYARHQESGKNEREHNDKYSEYGSRGNIDFEDRWYKFDDSNVSDAVTNDVHAERDSSSPYILIYKKINGSNE